MKRIEVGFEVRDPRRDATGTAWGERPQLRGEGGEVGRQCSEVSGERDYE